MCYPAGHTCKHSVYFDEFCSKCVEDKKTIEQKEPNSSIEKREVYAILRRLENSVANARVSLEASTLALYVIACVSTEIATKAADEDPKK